jgi:hypothetical protein
LQKRKSESCRPGGGPARPIVATLSQPHKRLAPKPRRTWEAFGSLLVRRAIYKATWQITPQIRFKHPEIHSHARVRGISRRPVRRAATVLAVPCVEGAITLLVSDALSLDHDQFRRAIVPQSSGSPTNRAIAFADLGWFVAQCQTNLPAMAAAVMFGHGRFLLPQVVMSVPS